MPYLKIYTKRVDKYDIIPLPFHWLLRYYELRVWYLLSMAGYVFLPFPFNQIADTLLVYVAREMLHFVLCACCYLTYSFTYRLIKSQS